MKLGHGPYAIGCTVS